MSKRLLSLLLWAALFLAVPASAEMVFSVDFENGTYGVLGDGSRRQMAVADVDGASRLQPGIKGKGCLVSPQHQLKYDAKGIVNPLKGSLSFWIKPVDWSSDSKEWKPIFWLGGDNGGSMLYYMLLTNSGMPQATFFTRTTGKELAAQNDYTQNEFFARDKWTFVVMNWNAWQVEFFFNGKLRATLSYSLPLNDCPLPNGYKLWFGNGRFWGKNIQYTSIIDEIRLYDDIQTPSDVETEYLANTAKVQGSSLSHCMTIPCDAGLDNIKLDGKRLEAEWENATCVPLNKDFFQGVLLPEMAQLRLKHDNEKLYFFFETDTFTGAAAAGKPQRSTKAFTRNVFEMVLRGKAAKHHTEPYSQIAIAPGGFWALAHDKNWDAPTGLQYAVSQENGITSIEGSLPLREIAPAFKEGQSFQAAFGYTLNERIGVSDQERIRCWSHGTGTNSSSDYSIMYHYPAAMGEIIFARDASFTQLNSFGNILYGMPAIQLKAEEGRETAVTVRNQQDTLLDRKVIPGTRGITIAEKLTSAMPLLCSVQEGDKARPSFFYETGFVIREPLQVTYEVFAKESKIALAMDASGINQEEQAKISRGGLPGKVELYRKGDRKNVLASSNFTLTSVKQKGELTFPALTRGEYELNVELKLPGTVISKSLPLEVPETDFLSNTRGHERKVFAPWTDVKVASPEEITMIGRKYRFNELGMPSKITAWNEEILAAPVEFIISRNGGKVIFRSSGKAKVVEKMPDRVIHTGQALSTDGSMRLNWRRTCEFDGMVLYRVEVASAKNGQPLKLDKVEIKFQVTPVASRYLMAPGHIADWDTKHTVAMPFMAYYWLSGIRTGIDFFLPDNGNWRIASGSKPLHFKRASAAGAASVTATIINERISIGKPLVYNFGFLATPAKPLNPRWRAEHVAGWGTTDCQTVQDYWAYNDKAQQLLFHNKALLHDVVNAAGAHAEVAMWHNRGTRVVPYSLHTAMPDNNRFYDFFGTEWRVTQNGIPGGKSFRSKFLGKEFYMCAPVCPTSTFSNFLNWCVGNLMEKYDFDGVYLDGSQTTKCDNREHGCGFTDAFGRKITPNNDLGCRESFRALYQTIHGLKPDGVLYCHANILNAPHVHSMCDIMLPGEELMPAIVGHPKMYTDNLPLERWQSSYNLAKLLGTNSVFLGMVLPYDHPNNRPHPDPRVANPLLAMLLVHDINLSGNMIYCKTTEAVWHMWDESGISSNEGTFVGYWYPECTIRTDNPKLLLSYYHFPAENRLILVLANRNPDNQQGKCILPPEFAGYDLKNARDLYNKKDIDISGGVTVLDRDFMVIEVKKK